MIVKDEWLENFGYALVDNRYQWVLNYDIFKKKKIQIYGESIEILKPVEYVGALTKED